MRVLLLPAAGALLVMLMATPSQARAQDAVALYKKSCVACHGIAGKGDGPMGPGMKTPDMTNAHEMAEKSDAQLEVVITKGGKGMRAFSTLTPAEVKALVAYCRTFSAKK